MPGLAAGPGGKGRDGWRGAGQVGQPRARAAAPSAVWAGRAPASAAPTMLTCAAPQADDTHPRARATSGALEAIRRGEASSHPAASCLHGAVSHNSDI